MTELPRDVTPSAREIIETLGLKPIHGHLMREHAPILACFSGRQFRLRSSKVGGEGSPP
ncbi:hypothetical protein J2046_006462 [Rhizobium petrolearium]|nr:hypothetical protein [Neorhizobium petrolearium]